MRTIKKIVQNPTRRTMIDQFYGYNHNPVIGSGEFYEMTNMTSDNFPIASTRKRRPEQPTGLSDGTPVQDAVAIAGRDDFGFSILNNGDIYCGGNDSSHVLYGVVDTGEVWETNCSASGVNVQVDRATFRSKVEINDTFTATYREYQEQWMVHDIPHMLSEYGITLRDTPVGFPQDGDTVTVVYIHDSPVNQKKQLVSMGAWVLIWPDKVYVNAVKLGNGDEMVEGIDYGNLEKSYDTDEYIVEGVPISIDIQPCMPDGTLFNTLTNSATAPEAPEDGKYWRDISNFPFEIKQWNAELNMWNTIESLVRIKCEGISGRFEIGDSVRIACYEYSGGVSSVSEKVGGQDLYCTVKNVLTGVNDGIVVNNLYVNKAHHTVTNLSRVTVQTVVPEMDYVVECGNRLWGCYYGEKNGEHINEIYACKLGDFKNWNTYAGISTDSYTASRGADGKFTGAAVLNGNPLFFRERSFEKVFPSSTGAHQITTVNYPGIQDGSDRSTAIIESTLYYKGIDGIYAYTGSVPRVISSALGNVAYFDGVAAPLGRKYYISMHDAEGNDNVFVFDTSLNLWHREDGAGFAWAEEFRDSIYFLDRNNLSANTQRIGAAHDCKDVPWSFETGIIGLNSPDQKRISRLVLRFKMELGARAKVYVQYNSDGHWHYKTELRGNGLHTTTYPIVPIRCDHMRIRMTGIGGMELYSLTYSTETGSDLP